MVEGHGSRRQLNPGVPAAVVDRHERRRKRGIGKRTYGDGYRVVVPLFGVEDGRPADRTESEYELRPLVADANVLGCDPENRVRTGETGQGGEDASGPALAGEAVADADAVWLAFDLNAELSAG